MRKVAIFLLIFLLFYGCIEERQISVSGYEQIESLSGTDFTGDGINDFILATYAPKVINPEVGVSIKKTVAVYPVSLSAQVISCMPLTDYDLQYVKNRINEFDEARSSGESSCFSALGMGGGTCTDVDNCLTQCTSYACTRAKSFGENTFGNELYVFSHESSEMDKAIADIEGTVYTGTEAQREELIEDITTLMALSSKISSSLLFRSDAFGACSRPIYDSGTLSAALSRLGNITVTSGSYEYKVGIIAESDPNEESIELYVKDTPPLLLDIDPVTLDVLEDGTLFEKEPITVGWDALELDASHEVMYYDFVSADEPSDEVLSKWKFPKIKERNLKALTYVNQVLSHPAGATVFIVSEYVFNSTLFLGYYAALGAAMSLWVILLFLLVFLGELLYFIAKAVMDRRNMREALLDYFGAPMTDWKMYGMVGAVLMGAAAMINLFYVAPVASENFLIDELVATLGSDAAGAGCVLLFVIGAYTIFLVIEDWLKGVVVGPGYYRLKNATKEENTRILADLRESWQALKMRVEDLSKTGMVVTEEYAIIVSVPIERLEQMIATGKQGMAKQLIVFNQERLEGLNQKLDEKVNVMNQKWPEWEVELAKALESSDQIPLNTLLFIPLQWREWAVEKYISENRAKGYVLEGDIVTRREVKVDDLLTKKVEEMVKSNLAQQAVILSKDVEVFNSFAKGKRTVADVLFLKLKAYSESLAKKMGANEVKRFVVSGGKMAAVYVSHDGHQAFIAAQKGRIKEVVDAWGGTVEKLK
ncbi:hypothetical protein JW721_00325 [Candidatus Micrarchaeota archaeon]|nr:hypothetical protein [Candidatus Micrarchaeota archaeon]